MNNNLHSSKLYCNTNFRSFPEMTRLEYRIYKIISRCRIPKSGKLTKNRAQIAALAGCSESTVRNFFKKFGEEGLLEFGEQSRKGGRWSRRAVYLTSRKNTAGNFLLTNKDKSLYTSNNNNNDFYFKESSAEKEEYKLENFVVSNNVKGKLAKKGISEVVIRHWEKQFIDYVKDDPKPWNGDSKWNPMNANFAFCKFFFKERAKYLKQGTRYISARVCKDFNLGRKRQSTPAEIYEKRENKPACDNTPSYPQLLADIFAKPAGDNLSPTEIAKPPFRQYTEAETMRLLEQCGGDLDRL